MRKAQSKGKMKRESLSLTLILRGTPLSDLGRLQLEGPGQLQTCVTREKRYSRHDSHWHLTSPSPPAGSARWQNCPIQESA